MPARVVKLLPEAEAEVIANERWYARRSPSAAEAFLMEIDAAIARIAEAPGTWPRYRRGTRRFPISLVYRIEPDAVYVIAVAHAKRRPEYWRRRKHPRTTR